ncbi:MAG: AAA family ATPase, partial [Deltaproteobacteria bacterium]|nr:AAA family ATPase [Deltaproteobacteria bacterium]
LLSSYKCRCRVMAEHQSKEAEIQNQKRIRFRSAYDLCAAPVVSNWLIKHFMTVGTGVIFGEPGTMKTFCALDIGLSVASNINWQGNEIRKTGAVFYIAGEGISAFNRRIKAWSIKNNQDLAGVPFYVSDRAAQLLDDSFQIIQAIDELQFENDAEPILIVIDTLSRNFGSGDESSTEDMARFVAVIDAILARYRGCTVLIVHHTGLSNKDRSRGSSVLIGAVDFEYKISKQADGTRIFTCIKEGKDFEKPAPIYFKPEIITLDGWHDPDDGEVLTSVVLVRTDGVVADTTKPLTGPRKITYDALVSIGGEKVHVKAWRKATYLANVSTKDSPDAKRKAFDRALKELHGDGLVDTDGADYWWIKPDNGQIPDNVRTCPET